MGVHLDHIDIRILQTIGLWNAPVLGPGARMDILISMWLSMPLVVGTFGQAKGAVASGILGSLTSGLLESG